MLAAVNLLSMVAAGAVRKVLCGACGTWTFVATTTTVGSWDCPACGVTSLTSFSQTGGVPVGDGLPVPAGTSLTPVV